MQAVGSSKRGDREAPSVPAEPRLGLVAQAGSAGGLFGTVFGILSMSCCAPLILPALLSFIGFSGMTLLQVNITVHEWVTPLTFASIGFMLVAIALVSRTITAVCALPPSRT